MSTTGIVKMVDDLGRVHIPKEIRDMMNLGYGDQIDMSLVTTSDDTGVYIIIKKHDYNDNDNDINQLADKMRKLCEDSTLDSIDKARVKQNISEILRMMKDN